VTPKQRLRQFLATVYQAILSEKINGSEEEIGGYPKSNIPHKRGCRKRYL